MGSSRARFEEIPIPTVSHHLTPGQEKQDSKLAVINLAACGNHRGRILINTNAWASTPPRESESLSQTLREPCCAADFSKRSGLKQQALTSHSQVCGWTGARLMEAGFGWANAANSRWCSGQLHGCSLLLRPLATSGMFFLRRITGVQQTTR